jgi:hypothetical protein
MVDSFCNHGCRWTRTDSPLATAIREALAVGKWFTRTRPMIDRVACPWLIKKFIDPAAEIIYLPKDRDGTWTTVVARAKAEGGISFDAPGADFYDRPDPDGSGKHSTTFEWMLERYHLYGDLGLMRLAALIHASDDRKVIHTHPCAAAIVAIHSGGREAEPDDQKLREKLSFVWDSLYKWCWEFPDGSYFKDPNPYA